jgi:hypothetical protein
MDTPQLNETNMSNERVCTIEQENHLVLVILVLNNEANRRNLADNLPKQTEQQPPAQQNVLDVECIHPSR